jgi:hypothetical protein
MSDFAQAPLFVFALTFSVLLLAAWTGVCLRKKWPETEAKLHDDFGIILAATLTLLALIIGFSFSMATARYDQRKNYEEQEANAIGTEYVRADLLSPADAAKVQSLLTAYLERRVSFYTNHGEQELQRIRARTVQLQANLWAVVKGAAAEHATPVVSLILSGMNDVLNSQGYAQAAFWNRIPIAAWGLMVTIAICCNLLLGYHLRFHAGGKLLVVLPIVIAIAFMLVADIDTPRRGIIRVSPQNLISLADSLRAQ